MLWVSTDIIEIDKFKKLFRQHFQGMVLLDLSKTPCSMIASESISITNHHSECCVFLGYLEPGWMLEPTHQTLMRKMIRKFPVAMCCQFTESLPFSWKNEIQYLYIQDPVNKNGHSNTINNGCIVQHKS
jgi:hypothetical protein